MFLRSVNLTKVAASIFFDHITESSFPDSVHVYSTPIIVASMASTDLNPNAKPFVSADQASDNLKLRIESDLKGSIGGDKVTHKFS